MITSNPTMEWVLSGWRKKNGSKRFSAKALAKAAKVGHPSVYRIMKGKGTPEQETLDKLGDYFEETAPVVEARKVIPSGATIREPETAFEWLGLARASIDRAESILKTRGTISGSEGGETLAKIHAGLQDEPKQERPRPGASPQRKASGPEGR
ncbi:MAG TPA: hypothetical protein VGQ24_05115 [Gemmatimonadales bacterium]|jgi:transcriptional regulator with XRE-family HTH domain|nr:hypothetical protein [Gemmatimonadales bacterium]